MRASLTLVAAGGIASMGWGEWLNRRWSRMLVTDGGFGNTAVVIPGFRNPQPSANVVNRWRVRVALRSIDPGDRGTTTLVFSGGAASAATSSEAQLMADYARTKLGHVDRVRLVIEDQSKTTWENIANVVSLIDSADRIKIASQPAHALKARAYLRRQRPDLAGKLARAADYRPGECILVKPLLALYGLWTLRALRPDERKFLAGGRASAPIVTL